jgi:xanthine dehydrogenase YagR molybdenum-binding subunit
LALFSNAKAANFNVNCDLTPSANRINQACKIEGIDMSQNQQRQKIKLEPRMESVIQIKQPMVRDFSTGGGHGPGDTLVEGDSKIATKKWQGYPPQNLNVVGKPMPPLAEVAMPRFLGKAEYATRIVFPNMLHVKILTSPHPRARIQRMDTSRAEKMPGVARILTYRDFADPKPTPGMMGPFNSLTQELGFFGEVVAVVAADTEDLAEDAAEAIDVQYDVLPSVPNLRNVMSPGAPDLRAGKGNLILLDPRNPHYDPNATWVSKQGDLDRGFAESDVIREFTYAFGGATAIPIQPVSCVAKWDGDKLTFWGMGQGITPNRTDLARGLGIDISNVRYINKYNG